MNQPLKVTHCPKCGGTELGLGRHSGYSAMYPKVRMSIGSEIEYLLCTECGYIIEGYVKKPGRFKGTLF